MYRPVSGVFPYGHLDVCLVSLKQLQMKLLTPLCKLPYGQFMSQRSSPRKIARTDRQMTIRGLLQLRGTLLLVLVLLITNGGAG